MLCKAIVSALLLALPAFAAEPDKTKPKPSRATCVVLPLGGKKDDVPQIKKAFNTCGTNGYVYFPEGETYNINSKLHITLDDVIVDWRGTWEFSTNLNYWRNNSYPIFFQNHRAGFIISGNDIHIDGYGTGGINGNGNAWYDAEQAITQEGRPMPFVWWNVTDVTVNRFSVIDPPLWSCNIMNGTNMWFNDLYCNATAVNAPYGVNWVQNTDGFNTMDATNIHLTNFVYQGGDDCIAVKPRSYDITARNVTCRGGNGIAIGSLGQYLEDSSVNNVIVDNVNIIRYNQDMHNCAYIKTWVGFPTQQNNYESDYQPRGGGWGSVTNILFSNFNLQGPNAATAITESNGDNGSYAGTSKMLISNVAFVNFTGYANTTGSSRPSRINSISCSNVYPCYDISYENYTVTTLNGSVGTTSCAYTAPGGVHGVNCTS